MRRPAIRHALGSVLFAMLVVSSQAVAGPDAPLPVAVANALAQVATPEAIADYRHKLKIYQEARAAFEEQAGAY